MAEIIIQIDTREQTPFTFPAWVKTERATISTGDYRLKDDYLSIERKSKSDFLGTISTGWKRFVREIERMHGWPCKIVIVESDIVSFYYQEIDNEIIHPDHDHPKLSPQFITKRIAELSFMGVSILFCCNTELASAIAYKILQERWKNINKESFK